MHYVLILGSLDAGGRVFWQSDSDNRATIVPMLNAYLEALQELNEMPD
jgi:hypothetical protein